MTDASLVIRADAGPAIGTGHVMRCLALAAGFRAAAGRNARIRFVSSARFPPALEQRLAEDGCEVTLAGRAADAGATARAARDDGATWVVVDGYSFDGSFEAALVDAGLHVVALDDFAHTHHTAELVVNQNFHATLDVYEPLLPRTRLLLGPDYALLRPEFWRYREAHRVYAPSVRNVLVTFGGADPEHVAPNVLRGLVPFGVAVRAIIGGADPKQDQTIAVARDLGFEAVVAPSDMSEHMVWADLTVASAGVTLLEMLAVGTPGVFVVSAENQRPGAEAAEKRGLVRLLGARAEITPEAVTASVGSLLGDTEARRTLGERGRDAVDGFGAERVCREMLGGDAVEIGLRAVEERDMRLLWEWANDNATRAASFDSAFIPWEDHVAWFSRKRADTSSVMYLAEPADQKPIGVVRFEVLGTAAELGVTVAPERRGRGFATRLIDRAVVKLFRSTPVSTVRAFVKPGNAPSLKAFEHAGFSRALSPRADAVLFVRNRVEIRA
jgi:UDP-2,4-diacetamido-2,4,6-trideoxy-beta-L-altropyranose hydrolase